MIFNYNFKINTKKVLELTGLKSANILDFGCGTGIWSDEDIKNNEKIHEITLYDKNYTSENTNKVKEERPKEVYRIKIGVFYEELDNIEFNLKDLVKIDFEDGKLMYFAGKISDINEAKEYKKQIIENFGFSEAEIQRF